MWDLFDSENPEDDATAAVERTASADYPVLEEILHVRPPLPHAVKIGRKENPTQIQAEGGWIHDYMHPLEGGAMQRIMNQPAYNWCRFRTERSHCMLPEVPDTENAKIAGYEVWFVKDRGFCPRVTWDAQEQCHVGEPGPNSGHPNALIECTKDWKDGGQRGGTPGVYVDHLASKEGSWADVRTKAARIRREGGVRVIANAGDTITAQVQGDNHVYQTSLMREPGKKAVAMWECSCPWSTYSWGRSGRWRKYEGRMCAHAMALVYEASAQEWGGQEIAEGAGFDEPVYHYEAPPQGEWRLDPVPDPNDFGHAASLHTAYDNSGKRGTKVWRGFLTWDIYPPDNRPLAERVEMGDHMLPANQALAQRFHDGTVTAQDLLKIVDTDSVGIYWAEAGPHPDENNRTGEEVARSYAGGERGVWPGHGGVDTSRLLASSWDERGPAGTEWADKYIHRGIGTAMIVLVAELGADAEEEDGEGMLELEEGHPLNLLEIQYNAGWGWHTVSVGGRRVTANVPRGTIQATAKGNSIFPTAIDPLTGEVYLNGQQITKYPSWDPNVGISDFEGGWIWTDAARHNDALLFEASADEAFLRTLRIEESGDSADQTRKLTVYEPGGSVVGFIEIYGRYYKKAKGQVQGIDVFPEYQRRGVATWLFKQAENWWPDLDVKHSTDLTDDGKAWKRSLGALDPERLGQCFNLALRYVRDHDGWKLAHGSIGGPGSALADPENPAPRIGHAWAVSDDGSQVWEPISDQLYSQAEFRRLFDGVAWITYDSDEALVHSITSGHWGPWDREYTAFEQGLRDQFATWKAKHGSRTATRGLSFKDMWDSGGIVFRIVAGSVAGLNPIITSPFGEGVWVLALKKMSFEEASNWPGFARNLLADAKSSNWMSVHGAKFTEFFLLADGRGRNGNNERWVIGQSRSLDGDWNLPSRKIKGSYGSDFEVNTQFLNHTHYDSGEDLRKYLAEELAGVNIDDSQFADVSKTKPTTVYRGFALKVGVDPMNSSTDRHSGFGHSWSLSLEAAQSIAERNGAGFSSDNRTKDAYLFNALRPEDDYVPAVYKAEVVISGGDGQPDTYRPWTIDYGSEREVDIPDGTEVTITGYMTAKPIVVSQKQKNDAAKAESKYAPEAMYLVRFEWPHSFSSANKRVTAKDDRFEGVALKEDDDGWYVTTHRARGDSYPTPEDIPQSEVDFIESTGALHIAAREVCDECGYNLPHHGWGCSKAPRQIALCPAHRGGREFGRGSDDMKLTCAVCGEHGQNVGFYKMASTHTATGGSYWYHLTDKVDFRLDPKKRPHSNTTLGGDLEPGIFLTQSPEHWINGYGYRQPWIVEFEISGSPSDLGGAMNETGFEIYVSAEHYDKLRITRVMAFDGYCREEYGSWGWTEDDLGTTYDTFEPIPDDQMGNAASYNKWRGYHAPDARQADSSWQSAYSSRVKKWRRGKNNAIASLKMRITAAQHTAGATYWHGSPSGDFSDTAGIHVGTKQAATEALCARIGWPVGGTWDGTREYGKTLLMGNKTMRERGLYPTGYNYKRSHQDKDADFYADGTATYGDGSRIPLSVKPDIFEVEIVGEMTNTSAQPYDDFKANSYMSGAIKRGTPRKGYYYTNVGEDSGSISAVVPPGGAHLRRVSSFVARITAAIEASDPLAGLVDVYETMAKKEHTHSGLIIKAIDSGRVLMTQRTPYAEDPEGVYGRWEFPGGSIDEGEDAFESALREFREETGLELPEDWAVEGCFENKKYLAIVILVPHEAWTTNAELLSHEVMGLGWFDPDQIDGTDLAREEVDNTEWDLVKEAIVSYPEGHEHAPGGSGHPGDGRGARSARPGSVGAGDAPGVAGAGRGRRVASTVSVKVLPAAIKSYNALDAPVRSAVLSAVKQLKQDTMPTGAKGLTGPLSGFMSLKVVTSGGDYRVLYKIVTGTYVIVLDIGSRENFYDRAIRAKDKHRKQAGRYADDADAQGYYPAGADGRVKLYRSVSDYGSHFASWDEVQATLDEEWGGHFGQWWGTQDEANFYASDAIVVGALWDPADLHHDPTSSGLIAREGAKGEIVELTLGGRTVPVPAGRTVTAATGITYQVDIVKTPDSLMPGVPESATVHAFQGGHEVGTMLLHADFDAKNTKSYRRWKVWNVWVDEGARRQGIAEGLVLALHAETPDMWVYHGGFMSEAGEDFGKGLVSKYPKWNKLATLDTEGILHEEPEAALPSVDGSVEEVNDDPLSESAIKARMALLGGPEELDIVAAAEAHLAKTAVKTFTPMEQMELIEEGAVEGVTASNLDLLQIEGTHYEILARAQLDEVDFG